MKKVKEVTFASAECGYCKRRVALLKVKDEWLFVTHPTRNGRPCYNAYGKPKGEITLPSVESKS